MAWWAKIGPPALLLTRRGTMPPAQLLDDGAGHNRIFVACPQQVHLTNRSADLAERKITFSVCRAFAALPAWLAPRFFGPWPLTPPASPDEPRHPHRPGHLLERGSPLAFGRPVRAVCSRLRLVAAGFHRQPTPRQPPHESRYGHASDRSVSKRSNKERPDLRERQLSRRCRR
jgi:hypothetical protein